MTSLTRGPLAAGVYWRRRLAVLGVALLLVVGVARLFGGDSEPGPRAATVSASTGAGSAPSTPSGPATVTVTPTPTPAATPSSTPTLPAPTGQCSDDDVVAAPAVVGAQATKTVVVKLTLRTRVTTACTWRVSPHSLQLKITSGSDRVWSTVECPRAIPVQDVVVRRDTDAAIAVAWSSRRSDEDCSQHTQWAMPGYYHATVAPLGGEPQDIQFRLSRPLPDPVPTPVPTPAPTPAAKPRATKPGTPTAGPTAGPRDEPTAQPRKRHRRVD